MALNLAAAILILALLVAAVCLRALLRRTREALPTGTVIYSDADGRGRTLVSPKRPLSGKPDYVLRTRRGALVPVELKSYRRGLGGTPHADLAQLGAYLVLLEDLHGTAPPYGVLRYTDHTLRVPYTAELRAEVLRLLSAITTTGANPPPGAPHPRLCRVCPFAPICDDRLG